MQKIISLLATIFLTIMTSIAYADATQDAAITAKINSLLLKDQLVEGDDTSQWNVFVSTSNQVVTLSGEVDDNEDKKRINDIAKSVDEVNSVQNNITINPSTQVQETKAQQKADIAQAPDGNN